MSDYSSPILDYDTPEEFDPTQDEKNIALLSHVLTLVVGFIAPLVIYLVKKDESEFVKTHAKESLNFQISIFIYWFFYDYCNWPCLFGFGNRCYNKSQ